MDAQRVVEEWVAALDRGDLDGSLEYVSPGIEWSNPIATVHGADELRGLLDVFWTAIPDFKHAISQIVASGDVVACEGLGTGTHSGPLAAPSGELPASGNAIGFPFAAWARVEDARIVRFRGYRDVAGFMAQLTTADDRAAEPV